MSATRRPAVPPSAEPSRFELIAGRLCLDFANTASRQGTDGETDHLRGFGDLVTWFLEAGVIGEADARRLREEAERRPADAIRALESARRLRGAIWRLFRALATGARPDPADLEAVSRMVAEGIPTRVLRDSGQGLEWTWEPQPGLEWPLWQVAWSAAELATSDELGRVKVCEGGECGWLFVDRSRNRSRRWCSMEDCGNVIKARRHYARVKARK